MSGLAEAFGAGNDEEIRKRAQITFGVAGVAGVAGGVIMALLMYPLFLLGGATDNVIDVGLPFFGICCVAVPFILLTRAANGIFNGLHIVWVPLVAQICCDIVYVGVSWLALSQGWGLTAFAGAYTGGFFVGFCFDACVILLTPSYRQRFGLFRRAAASPGHEGASVSSSPLDSQVSDAAAAPGGGSEGLGIVSYLRESLDLFVRSVLLQMVLLLSTLLSSNLGSADAGAYQLIIQLWVLVSSITDAWANTGTMGGASMLSKGEYSNYFKLMVRIIIVCEVIGCAFMIVYAVFRDELVRFFTDSDEVREVIFDGWAWWVFVGVQPVNALVFALDGFLYATRDFRYIRNALIIGVVCVYVPLGVAYFCVESMRRLGMIFLMKGILNLWRALSALYRTIFRVRKQRRARVSEILE